MKHDPRDDPSEFLDQITPQTALTPGARLICPNCQAEGRAPSLPGGSLIRCNNCGASLTVPGGDPFGFLGEPVISRGRYYQPDRGSMILTFGILGFFIFPLAIVAWVMGSADLREIDSGRMNPLGRSMTSTGTTLGIVATILGVVGIVLYAAFVATLFGRLHWF